MAKTIVLKGNYIRKEDEADAAITPGHLIERTSTGVKVHATIGGAAAKAFALENDLIGKGIDDAYAAGDAVQYGVFQPGAEVNAKVTESSGCTKGAALESDGAGGLVVASTPIEGSIIGYAMETISAAGRCRVEVA